MKRFFALLCSTLMIVSVASAQKLTVIGPDVAHKSRSYMLNSHRCEAPNGTRYLYSFAVDDGDVKKTDKDFIFTIEDDRVTKTTMDHPENMGFLKCYDNEDGLAAFYLNNNRKEKVYTLYQNSVSPNGGKAPWKPEEILNFTYEKQDNLMIATAISPDKSKNLIAFIQLQRKGSYKGNVVCVFDNKGDMIWQNTLDLDVNTDYFSIIDMAINNDGVVFAGVYTFDAPNNHTRTNEALSMYEITESNTASVTENVKFHISNGKMIVGKSGKIHIGGYYYQDLKKNENGSYIVTYDPKSSNFTSISNQDFPATYKEKNPGGLLAGFFCNQEYHVSTEALYECSNGAVVLLGEQKTMRAVQNQQGMTTYYYLTKNIVYNKTDANGDIDKFELFDKKQMATAGTSGFSYKRVGISCYPFFDNDKIYILYADNLNNYKGKSGVPYKAIMSGKALYCCTLLTIDENGNGSTKKLLSNKDDKRIVTTPLFFDGNDFIVVEETKKQLNISKLSVN